jgi:hypothetical protein
MKVNIRQENTDDRREVYEINSLAFGQEHEAKLVGFLRDSNAFVPECSVNKVSLGFKDVLDKLMLPFTANTSMPARLLTSARGRSRVVRGRIRGSRRLISLSGERFVSTQTTGKAGSSVLSFV